MTSARKRATTQGLREQLIQDPLVRDMICRRAYEIYQDRGKEHGHDREDWLQAESEILYELIGQELNVSLAVDLIDFPGPQLHNIPSYEPFAARPDSTAPEPAPSGFLWDQSIPGAVKLPAALPPAATESSRKKAGNSPKSTSSRKHKKAAEPADDEAARSAPATSKGKKSGHKGKKKEKKAEHRAKEKRSGKARD